MTYSCKPPDGNARCLLISRVGKPSLHDHWLHSAAPRKFDVLLSSYEPDPRLSRTPEEGVEIEARPGRKVSGYSALFGERPDLLKAYDFICLWDEDLLATAESLNEMFRLCVANGFRIAQPSLTSDSFFTYAATLSQPVWAWRHVNYVEMMCPVFRSDALAAVLPLFGRGYESGIDLAWCHLAGGDGSDYAILDAVAVKHTEPVGGRKQQNGFGPDRRYEDDIYAVLSEFDLQWTRCVPFSAVRRSGRVVRSRALLAASGLFTIGSIWRQPKWRLRSRAVAVHLKHLVTVKPCLPVGRHVASTVGPPVARCDPGPGGHDAAPGPVQVEAGRTSCG